ncbi:MAG: hypothetical protein AAF602_04115 [Myxococcota bacterium]
MATIEVQTGPLAAVEQQLELLSPRDRMLLVGLVLFLTALLVGGYWYLLYGMLESKAEQVREANDTLVVIQELKAELDGHRARFEAQEERIRTNSSRPVPAWVEELANRHSLSEQLRKVDALSSEPLGDTMQRTHYKVEIQRAPQEELYRFLYDLETSPFPASISEANFKVVRRRNEKLMDLTLDLEVLKLGEAG